MIFRHTKIGATIGPNCEQKEILSEMMLAGMSWARLNFSHGTHENHAELIKNIRETAKDLDRPIAILQDLQGPKIRIGKMPESGFEIKLGEEVILNTTVEELTGNEIPLTYPGLEEHFKPGERILVDDGRVELTVLEAGGGKIKCKVVEGGVVTSHKGINLPDTKLSIPILGEKDKNDLKFGIQAGVDVVALSFVHEAKDILDLRFLIKEYEKELGIKEEQSIKIIAKIERREAVNNIDSILEVVDGVMIARGDLGLELNAAEVPLVQKSIIDKANHLAKPVIVATQMLDSMKQNRRPTRAEVSDVANAVIDHADSLMLSNETAVGNHPTLVIKTMSDIISSTEKSKYDDTDFADFRRSKAQVGLAVTELSRLLAEEVHAKLILAASISGETGRLISHVRPSLPILVATGGERARRQLNLSWGVYPFILPECKSIEELVERSINYIKDHKIAKKGDKMIVVAGEPVGHVGTVNLVEVREIN